jgi:hypothetical protein
MKSYNSFEKEPVKPFADYQIENLRAQIKPKAFMFKMHIFLAAIWIFNMTFNLIAGKNFLAAINFLCVLAWSVSAYLNRNMANEKKKEMQAMIDANEKVENQIRQEKESMDSLDFFKKEIRK